MEQSDRAYLAALARSEADDLDQPHWGIDDAIERLRKLADIIEQGKVGSRPVVIAEDRTIPIPLCQMVCGPEEREEILRKVYSQRNGSS